MEKRKEVIIYTDGACSGNPGPGGWGAILKYNQAEKEISGGERSTTNNRMELSAAIFALKMLKEPCKVTLYSDSQYLVNAMNEGWAESWRAKGWKRKGGPALNPDLWEEILVLCEIHEVEFIWVKGHASNPYNNRCDELAVKESKKYQ